MNIPSDTYMLEFKNRQTNKCKIQLSISTLTRQLTKYKNKVVRMTQGAPVLSIKYQFIQTKAPIDNASFG